uniref:Uncharacterized protein n=1 Tax=Tanacetum cinerariifolium TaxID=118510 RepID=A0A6L2L8C6_TANCI|nr:hypothetical protein [Tanacetum cinerariifolium]
MHEIWWKMIVLMVLHMICEILLLDNKDLDIVKQQQQVLIGDIFKSVSIVVCFETARKSSVAVVDNMDTYRDQDMGEVIVGKLFCKEVCVKARWFNGFITIGDYNDSVTYQYRRIDNDIYYTFDAFPNACEMWKAIERLKQEWQMFVTLVKQSQELKTVFYDILKQQQNEVNEIKAERLAHTTNPVALVA